VQINETQTELHSKKAEGARYDDGYCHGSEIRANVADKDIECMCTGHRKQPPSKTQRCYSPVVGTSVGCWGL